MSMFDAKDLTKPRPGFLYEPRVLWGRGKIVQYSAITDPGVVIDTYVTQPSPTNYLNGERWPIVLTRMITLAQGPFGQPWLGGTLMNTVPVEIGALGASRLSLGSVLGLVDPLPSNDPPTAIDARFLGDFGRGLVNSNQLPATRPTLNVARWDFEHALRLPPAAFLEWQVSGRIPNYVVDTSLVPVTFDANFYASAPNEAAQWPASAITKRRMPLPQLTIPTAQYYFLNDPPYDYYVINEGSTTKYSGLPPFGFSNAGPESRLYPPDSTFTSRDAVQQKASYDLPTNLSGMSIAVDQNELDNFTATGGYQGSALTTTYSRIRTRNGGTGNYWWRDGAPLAICTPTITPASVSCLKRPMALQPGEGFKLTIPRSYQSFAPSLPFAGLVQPDPVGQPDLFFLVFEVDFYISFCGYAVVEA